MKYLKLFENYNKEDIDSICKKYDITNYTINKDGSIDVNDDVYLYSKGLTELPLRFRNVSGYFQCSLNELTSLYGCPESVGGYFDCEDNKIRTLETFPKHIGGYGICGGNPVYHLWNLFKEIDKVELFNDFGITDGEVIILDRLNEFLDMIGKPMLTTNTMNWDIALSYHRLEKEYKII